MKQQTMSDMEYNCRKKKTKREEFLEIMDEIIPWGEWVVKARHKALSGGGMKFLYAQGYVVAIARFCEDEVFVTVISASDKTEKIRLPLGAAGATEPKGGEDVFGQRLEYRRVDGNSIELTVEAHQSYFIECQMR